MELTKQRLITIITGAIVIIAVGLYLFLYGPLINRLRVMRLECNTIETEVLQARNRISSVEMTAIKKGLITEKDVSLAIDELTREGKLGGINFVSISPRQIEEQKARYRILPIEMKIESTYEELGIFLGLLDGLEKSLVTVRDFNVMSDKENPAKLKTKLVVNMYLSGQKGEE